MPTFPENFMQIREFMRKVANRQTGNDD